MALALLSSLDLITKGEAATGVDLLPSVHHPQAKKWQEDEWEEQVPLVSQALWEKSKNKNKKLLVFSRDRACIYNPRKSLVPLNATSLH